MYRVFNIIHYRNFGSVIFYRYRVFNNIHYRNLLRPIKLKISEKLHVMVQAF